MSRAYCRFPTVFLGKVVFTSEDDLWEVGLEGGIARRLTAGRGSLRHPQYSPDGRLLAFTSKEEGHEEVYIMPSEGGDLRRLTYLGSSSVACGWLDAETVLFRSPCYEAHFVPTICSVGIAGGIPRSLRLGPAASLALSRSGQAVLERNDFQADPAHWKRYRGGTVGKLWIASNIDGEFKPLVRLSGNLARPLWVGARVYFVSDHEAVGNLFSCTPEGEDLRRETRHENF
jgi:tricorn protease